MHEIGHLLGLKHKQKGTIMYKYNSNLINIANSDLCQLIDMWREWFGLTSAKF